MGMKMPSDLSPTHEDFAQALDALYETEGDIDLHDNNICHTDGALAMNFVRMHRDAIEHALKLAMGNRAS
jgi:hypothetical protein